MKKASLFIALLGSCAIAFSQQVDVYPTHWFIGMKNPRLQLMLHATGIGSVKNVAIKYPGITVKKVNTVENKNYLFVDLTIQSAAKPGKFTVELNTGGTPVRFDYEL